jgi:hypothetical protein
VPYSGKYSAIALVQGDEKEANQLNSAQQSMHKLSLGENLLGLVCTFIHKCTN